MSLLLIVGLGGYFWLNCDQTEAQFKKSLPRAIEYANWKLVIQPEGVLSATPSEKLQECVSGSGSWKLHDKKLMVKLLGSWKCEPNEPETHIDPPQLVEEDLEYRLILIQDSDVQLEPISKG